MADNTPLSCESLECVLTYLDLNKRNPEFEYSLTMPTGNSEFNVYGAPNPDQLVYEFMPEGSAVLMEEP